MTDDHHSPPFSIDEMTIEQLDGLIGRASVLIAERKKQDEEATRKEWVSQYVSISVCPDCAGTGQTYEYDPQGSYRWHKTPCECDNGTVMTVSESRCDTTGEGWVEMFAEICGSEKLRSGLLDNQD